MREDIAMLFEMVAYGFEPVYSTADKREGRILPLGTPHFNVGFKKGNLHLWLCKDGWQVAELIDNKYCNHRGVALGGTPYKVRFSETNGFIPDLKTVIELYKKEDL